MASFVGHIRFSTALGLGYGALAWHQLQVPPAVAALGGVLTAAGGMLPDLDSDSGVPVREIFGVAAMLVPALLHRSLAEMHLSHEEALLVLLVGYFLIRFGVRAVFKRLSVHRGMYHSIPAMLIAGLSVFLLSRQPNPYVRGFYAVGTMVGFFSHLLLDEIYAVDFRGLTFKQNQFAGTALKLYSPSWIATLFCYSVLAGLGFLAYNDFHPETKPLPTVRPNASPSPQLHDSQPKIPVPKWVPRYDGPPADVVTKKP